MTKRERCSDMLAVFAAGLLAFLVYAPTAILHPFNVAWTLRGDPAWHLSGLLYFIRDPWTLPLGKLFRYGEGFSTSIVYTDSIPLMAIAIKVLTTSFKASPLIFQPFGLWFLLCFILQAWFSFRLARLFIGERSICVLIGFLACLSPPFLLRGFGHEALMAHWLIIWALMLNLDENGQSRALGVSWPLLLGVSLGVHAYIFFMCAALWVTANFRVLLVRPCPWRKVLLSAVGTGSSVLILAYAYGYFMPVAKARFGYEVYKLNLLAPLNPMGWSIVLPSFRDMTGGEYEGFSYFGLGILIILVVASLRSYSDRPFWLGDKVLFISLLVSTAIALTPYLHIGALHIGALRRRTALGLLIALVVAYWLLPMRWTDVLRRHMRSPAISLTGALVGAGLAAMAFVPWIPEEALGLVRGSGRLFWPTWYFYFFLGCVVLGRTMASRRVCILLVGCSLVQIVDLSPGVARLNRNNFSVGRDEDRAMFVSRHLTDTIKGALVDKRRLSIVADGSVPHGWEPLVLLALLADVGIDKAPYARIPVAYEEVAAARLREVQEGLFHKDTVYLVYPEYRDSINRSVAESGSAAKSVEAGGYLVVWAER